jgi:diaminopimelate epimerase
MRMFNADGSEAEMCGNASRCVGKFVYEKGLTKKENISLETKAGVKILEFTIENQKVKKIRVDMGEPILTTGLIPAISINEQIINETIDIEGKVENITCVSMGNPHTVIFKQNIGEMNIEEIGKKIEIHKMFPRKTNVEFVEVKSKELLNMRVWERGAGETLACGTGACATLIAASVNGLSKRKATVQLLGGNLEIEWSEANNHVYMTGDATFVFEGEIQL